LAAFHNAKSYQASDNWVLQLDSFGFRQNHSPMKANRFCGLLCVAFLTLASVAARAELMYANTGNSIARFDSATPGTVTTVGVTGLQPGEFLVGIDIRPGNGLLYAIGSMSRLYTVNPLTGLALQVGTAGAFTLNGSAFGTDFNPVVDRLRLVSNAEQNLRINPNDGTLTGNDGALNPAGNVVAIAYSNNFSGATSTVLYAIDSATGLLGIITVPNSGGPITTVGSLGLGAGLSENMGFDISGLTGTAYGMINGSLYTINLSTGAATLVGFVGNAQEGGPTYLGLTAATAVPEPSSFLLFGAAAAGLLGYKRLRRAEAWD
jgi:hypothetical protein